MKKNAPTARPLAQYTLASLVAELLVEWLHSLTSGFGIRMRYDEHFEGPADRRFGGKKRGKCWAARERQIPTVIERRRLRIQLSYVSEGSSFVGRIIFSCDRRNIRAPLCAECNGAPIDAHTWTQLVVPPRAFAPGLLAKEVDRALSVPDTDGEIRTGHYDIIQVSDGMVVTLYRWTRPAKGPIWYLASRNGYDVSSLKWTGGKTYAEIDYDLLADCPGFPAAVGLGLRRDFLCEGDTRLDFKYLDRGRCYTIAFRLPNFHPMTADPLGIWTSRLLTSAPGLRRRTALTFRSSPTRSSTAARTWPSAEIPVSGWPTSATSPGRPSWMQRPSSPASRPAPLTMASSSAPETRRRKGSTQTSCASPPSSAGYASSCTSTPLDRSARRSTSRRGWSTAPSRRTPPRPTGTTTGLLSRVKATLCDLRAVREQRHPQHSLHRARK